MEFPKISDFIWNNGTFDNDPEQLQPGIAPDTSNESAVHKFGDLKGNWTLFFSIIPLIWLESLLEEVLDRGFLMNWIERMFSSNARQDAFVSTHRQRVPTPLAAAEIGKRETGVNPWAEGLSVRCIVGLCHVNPVALSAWAR